MVMAQIYTMCGEFDEAIEEIEYLLSQESNYTVNDFKIDDTFDPLRDMPEFQALMTKYALPSNL